MMSISKDLALSPRVKSRVASSAKPLFTSKVPFLKTTKEYDCRKRKTAHIDRYREK